MIPPLSTTRFIKNIFSGQDPTRVNGQGNDRGTQYRSIVFYRNSNEKKLAGNYIKIIQPGYPKPITAEVKDLTKFWTAEEYHQNYIHKNPSGRYVQNVSIPEIKKLQRQYSDLIKPDHVY